MLERVAAEIANCHRRAADCRARAEASTDPDSKRDLLALESSWLFLASSYEQSEQSSTFTNAADLKKKE